MAATTQNSGGYYYGSSSYNIQLTVPISMNCPSQAYQLWATGTAYDTVRNTNLGSNSISMNSNNGYYSGQLAFTVPSSVVEHQLQIQIQVYNSYINGQYSGLVATSSPTVTIHSSTYSPPTNSYPPSGSNSYYNGYPNGYYNGYYYYYGYPYSYCYGYSYFYPYSYYYYNGQYYYYYPGYYYYYYSYPVYPVSSCYNGQMIVYYNGAYYYASCYYYDHAHH